MNKTIITSAIAAFGAGPSIAQQFDPDGYHSHMWGGGYGMGYGFFGLGLMILFWAVVIVLAVVSVRWLSHSGTFGPKRDDALEILKQRLAKGEIDPEEYATRKKALEE